MENKIILYTVLIGMEILMLCVMAVCGNFCRLYELFFDPEERKWFDGCDYANIVVSIIVIGVIILSIAIILGGIV